MPSRAAGRGAGEVLLSPAAMAAVDRGAAAAGIAGTLLMERAGRSVTRAITARFRPQPILVLCGPGNNGGDGYVVARRLVRAGWQVRLASAVPAAALKGDAAWAAGLWRGPVEELDEAHGAWPGLVVDALFGAGLQRPLEGAPRAVVERLGAGRAELVAIDVPSGVDGATGAVLGATAPARLTVTFCRAKPGHVLLPGRELAGELVVADIGIPDEVVAAHDEGTRRNGPALWRHALPRRRANDHKYHFGHAVVAGGPAHATGAARLAAMAALRAGAGLVSVAAEPDALPAYASALTTVMTKRAGDAAELAALLADTRLNAVLIGPGQGVSEATRERVLTVLRAGRATVLDAEALTSFAEHRASLFAALHERCVLTPHDGEFQRLFDHEGDRLGRARAAAAEIGAVVLLKGGDTVIAAPDGRAAIASDAPAELATAGTGDVLAGIITGLLAQGVAGFEAACAGAWLQAAAARAVGGPLIAEDLPSRLPTALTSLY